MDSAAAMTGFPPVSNVTSGVHSATTTWVPLLSTVLLGSRRSGSPMPMVTLDVLDPLPPPLDPQAASEPPAMIGTASQATSFAVLKVSLLLPARPPPSRHRRRLPGMSDIPEVCPMSARYDVGLPEVRRRVGDDMAGFRHGCDCVGRTGDARRDQDRTPGTGGRADRRRPAAGPRHDPRRRRPGLARVRQRQARRLRRDRHPVHPGRPAGDRDRRPRSRTRSPSSTPTRRAPASWSSCRCRRGATSSACWNWSTRPRTPTDCTR